MAKDKTKRTNSIRSAYPTDWSFRPNVFGKLRGQKSGDVTSFARSIEQAAREAAKAARRGTKKSKYAFRERWQRVTVKARVVRHGKKGGKGALRAHVRYLLRDGVGKKSRQVVAIKSAVVG